MHKYTFVQRIEGALSDYPEDNKWLHSNETGEGTFIDACEELNVDFVYLRMSVLAIQEKRLSRPPNATYIIIPRTQGA